ncbi:MAG: hypothetical protein EZS28_028794 [Streblomastix strix]|uniref:Uncharacterized protein n=1 Tax=Streblomastix strix TaxID=222440 RepID=A0A5J4UZ37_9EUKA|nr:MAG: hypothetical protein EZS28_028794 [Streblomastix strix]
MKEWLIEQEKIEKDKNNGIIQEKEKEKDQYVDKDVDEGVSSVSEFALNLALSSLALLALNQDNHEAIIDGNGIKIAVERIMQVAEHGHALGINIISSVDLLVHLLAFGSIDTQQQIQNSISLETLIKLKDDQYIGNEIQKLINAYTNPQEMKEYIQQRRNIERTI